jgi:hypothetical protein
MIHQRMKHQILFGFGFLNIKIIPFIINGQVIFFLHQGALDSFFLLLQGRNGRGNRITWEMIFDTRKYADSASHE